MTAEIIILDAMRPGDPNVERPVGNGALKVIKDYFDRVHPARVMARAVLEQGEGFEGIDALPDADNFLAWLAREGFCVVPMPGEPCQP